jgi:hypothetical protein
MLHVRMLLECKMLLADLEMHLWNLTVASRNYEDVLEGVTVTLRNDDEDLDLDKTIIRVEEHRKGQSQDKPHTQPQTNPKRKALPTVFIFPPSCAGTIYEHASAVRALQGNITAATSLLIRQQQTRTHTTLSPSGISPARASPSPSSLASASPQVQFLESGEHSDGGYGDVGAWGHTHSSSPCPRYRLPAPEAVAGMMADITHYLKAKYRYCLRHRGWLLHSRTYAA